MYNGGRHLAYPVLKLYIWTLPPLEQQEGKVCAKFQIQSTCFHSKSYNSMTLQMHGNVEKFKFVLNFNKFIDFFLDGDFVAAVGIQISINAQAVTLSWRWCRGAMVIQKRTQTSTGGRKGESVECECVGISNNYVPYISACFCCMYIIGAYMYK